MTEYHVPKGVSADTLRTVVAGWYEAGAATEPTYTAAVEDATGIADAVGRQTRFLEELGVLETDGQRRRLTDAGRELGERLAAGDERARETAYRLLDDWALTDEVRGLLAANPTAEETLVSLVATLAGRDPETSRIETGVRALLDLYAWAGVLGHDDEDRYRLPESGDADAEPPTVTLETDGGDSVDLRTNETVHVDVEGGPRLTLSVDDAERETADERDHSSGAEAAERLDDAESATDLAAALTDAASAASAAAEEARTAAEQARSAAGEEGSQPVPAADSHAVSLDLDLDIDPDDLEAIVGSLKGGLHAED